MTDRGGYSRSGRRHRRGHQRRRHRYLRPAMAMGLLLLALASWVFVEYGSWDDHSTPDITGGGLPQAAVVRLPADDAPHQNYMEWWYYNCHLRSLDGKEFSFHYVFFLINSVVSYTVAQISLTDHQTGRHYTAQRESPGNPSAGAPQGFDFTLGDWVMSGYDGKDKLQVMTRDFAFDLRLTNAGSVLYHGGVGLIQLGDAGNSFYYSRPRMDLAGRLTLGGKTMPVTGQSWFDHQWGDFQTGTLAWDWFALQLNDGADIMLYRLRDRTGRPVLYSGTYTRNGSTALMGEGDFSAESTGSWRSKATGVTYPVAWRVRIPSRNVDLQIKPIAPDAEIDARTTTYNTYWEGAITIEGSHRGRGFLEISPGGPQRSESVRR